MYCNRRNAHFGRGQVAGFETRPTKGPGSAPLGLAVLVRIEAERVGPRVVKILNPKRMVVVGGGRGGI